MFPQGVVPYLEMHHALGGVPGHRGVPDPGGVHAQVLPPVDRMTHACENITLPQLRCGQ